MEVPISVIITTFNEAHNIEGVLQSVLWSAEIIVVDSFSTDGTAELAKKYDQVSVLTRAYKGPADQKNWAIPQAKQEWVLILDADERIPSELRAEIIQLVQTQPTEDAFWINRKNYFLGQPVHYSGWQNDAVIRLIKRDRCRYNQKRVHEEIQTEGLKVGRLKNAMLHYTYKDVSHFLEKMERYARWSAEDHEAKVPTVGIFHLLLKPAFRFFKHFILKGGFKDGRVGIIISIIMAWGVFLRYLFMIQQRQFKK